MSVDTRGWRVRLSLADRPGETAHQTRSFPFEVSGVWYALAIKN